jgi:Rrf2 family protein
MAIVSKKVRYALHGLAYISAHARGRPVPFDEILAYLEDYSNELTLAPSYIAKIFQEVSRAGITAATSGPGGGYRLIRPPESIRLIEIVEALDGPIQSHCCLLSVGACTRNNACAVQEVVREAEIRIYSFFEDETLAGLGSKMSFPPREKLQSEAKRRE